MYACPAQTGYRVPRIVADLVTARPVHLAVINGIYTMTGGELPLTKSSLATLPVHPGLLIAGKNCVSTDAVAMALMGFNPMSDRGTPPFETSDNMLGLAEQLGVGTRDLKRIEVVGTPISNARFPISSNVLIERYSCGKRLFDRPVDSDRHDARNAVVQTDSAGNFTYGKDPPRTRISRQGLRADR